MGAIKGIKMEFKINVKKNNYLLNDSIIVDNCNFVADAKKIAIDELTSDAPSFNDVDIANKVIDFINKEIKDEQEYLDNKDNYDMEFKTPIIDEIKKLISGI